MSSESRSAAERQASLPDVRMRGFAHRDTVDAAVSWIAQHASPLERETIALADGYGRVLAESVSSEVDVPGFRRAMMDGFAVQAQDTTGAAAYSPLPLRLVGSVLPGESPTFRVAPGTAARIMTGAPLPVGADAVLPVEKTQLSDHGVMVLDAVTPGKHVAEVGEDVAKGTRLFRTGRRLRPQDLGVLSSVGVPHLTVWRPPRVRIVITGNELLPSGSRPTENRTTDANGPMLASLVERDGGKVVSREIIDDRPESILAAMCDDVDIVLVSGGSSVGLEDYAPQLLREHGTLAFHGIAMRPSSPSGMGMLENRLVFLLPGNPVSCLCSYDFFAARAIRQQAGRSPEWPYPRKSAKLARKLVSQVGRVDYARVRFVDGRVEPIAISGASILSSTTFADGFVVIPADHEGYAPGTHVEVFLYDA